MKLVPLGTVAEVIAGQSPEGIYYNTNGEGTPFYQGKKEFGDRFLGAPTTWTTKITKLAQHGDILMSVRAPVGPINFSTQQVCIGRGLASIRASELVDKNFLFYFLLHKQPEISGNTGAVFDSINKGQIASIEIPLPTLEKQLKVVKKIETAFSEVDSLSTKKNHQFSNSREIFRAVCKAQIELLNPNSYLPLKELSALITKGTTPTTLGHKFKDMGINFIKVEAIDESGNLIPGKFNYIDDSAHKALLRSQLQENDVLVSITGALGRSTLVGLQHIPANISQNLAIVRLPIESKITHHYLASLFMSDYFGLNQIGAGVAQQALSLAQIGSLQVPILTIENQDRFIDFIQESQQSTEILCQNLRLQQLLFSELKSAILSNVFNGAA